MRSQDQIELERAAATSETVARPIESTVKTILLHVQNDPALSGRIEAALSLARACGAHLSCVRVMPAAVYAAFDGFEGILAMDDVAKALSDEEARIRTKVEDELRCEDVSWDFLQVNGTIEGQIARHAALADLVVTGRERDRAGSTGPAIGLLGDLLHRLRTPLFIPADDGRPPDPTGNALVAWDGSYEAANAVRAAVGLLRLASDVTVLRIREQKENKFPSTRLLEYLSRHDIHAELRTEDLDGKGDIAVALKSYAKGLKAAYLVMGGYHHSRIGELVFGGVTRTMLQASPVPLMIAH